MGDTWIVTLICKELPGSPKAEITLTAIGGVESAIERAKSFLRGGTWEAMEATKK